MRNYLPGKKSGTFLGLNLKKICKVFYQQITGTMKKD